MSLPPGPHDIDVFFRGLTEHAFHARLGIVDPPLVDYVALLLVRFLRSDQISSWPRRSEVSQLPGLCDPLPPPPEAASDQTRDAAAPPPVDREAYRDVGDAVLFWRGLYPEAMQASLPVAGGTLPSSWELVGQRAYLLASTCPPLHQVDDGPLLERLSHDFELCVAGLAEVRRMWGQ